MGDSLTSDLALKLQQATQDVNRFVDNQVDLLESSDMNFEQTIEDSESTMEALSRNENNLDGLRIRQNAIKERQQGEIIEIKSDIDQLRKEQLQLQPEIKKLQEEEITELQRLENFKKGLLESRAAREKALNDLTKGIKLYQQLGLQFEKAENNCMQFIFTQIDPQNHSRKFEFFLLVDEEDCYQLVDSVPALDVEVCKSLIIQLNEDNDISRFAVNMRREYQNLVSEGLSRCI